MSNLQNRTGNSDLSEKQKDDLDKLYASIDNDVQLVNQLIHKDAFRFIKERNISKSIIVYILIILALSLAIVSVIKYSYTHSNILVVDSLVKEDYKGSNIDVQMLSNKVLKVNVKNICINSNNNSFNVNNIDWLYSSIDTVTDSYTINNELHNIDNNMDLNTLDLKDNRVYINYSNDNGNACKEIIISASKPNDIELGNIGKVNNRYFEYVGHLENKAYTNSYNGMFIMLVEKVAGGELRGTSLKENIHYIESSITMSDSVKPSDIVINFSDNVNVHLDKLSVIKEHPQVIFDNKSNILRIRNYKENIDLIYVFAVNNEYAGLHKSQFVETNINGLYVNKDFNKQDTNGYNTYMLNIDSKMYCFKFSGSNKENIEKDWFNQFNIDITQLKF